MVYGAPMDEQDAVSQSGPCDTGSTEQPTMEKQASFSLSSSATIADALGQDWANMSSISRFRDLPAGPERNLLVDFLRIMAACNTVMLMPDVLTGELHVSDKASLEKCLQAESADEVALVTAAVEFSEVILTQRDVRSIVVKGLDAPHAGNSLHAPANFQEWASRVSTDPPPPSHGREETYTVLAVNVFDSDRKRMSVLLKVDGEYVLLCKGADTSLLPLCAPNQYYEQCAIHIDQFATSGLRTLVFAKRTLTEADATSWMGEFMAASNSLVNRPQMLARCAVDIEQNMDLVGAVGIEDELQDGVASSIKTLQDSGLNVWMITGDKAETALAISRICGLVRPGMEVEKVIGLKGQALRRRLVEISDLLQSEYLTPEEELEIENKETVAQDKNNIEGYGRQSLSRYYRDTVNRLSSLVRPNKGDDADSLAASGLSSSNGGASHLAHIKHAVDSRNGKKSPRSLVLAVDGTSLEAIWSDNTTKAQFYSIAHTIPTVVACRVSPLQKASLVRLVKMGPGKPITLAIGDGANDIGMIHEARIGVGISGKEGKHAANSADFAIGQFRFIVPLLLIHGRYNYIRGSKLVLYSFFKNLVLVSTLFYYCNYSGFSGTIYLDSIVFSGYNFYLGMPIVMMGIWDKDVSVEAVLRHPKLAYQTGRLGELLSMSSFLRWCLSAFFQGMILFAVAIRVIAGSADASQGWDTDYRSVEIKNFHGRDGGIYVDGFFLYTCVVVCMHLKVAYMTNTWTWIHWALWVLSFVGYLFFSWVYSQFGEVFDWYKVVDFTMGTGLFYLGILVVAWLLYMTDTVLRISSEVLFPTSQGRLRAVIESEGTIVPDSQDAERKKTLRYFPLQFYAFNL